MGFIDGYKTNRDGSFHKVVPGEVEVRNEGVNIIANSPRVGHVERTNAMRHIIDMADRGYITNDESNARLRAAQAAEKQADINALTVDLPAPFVKTNFFQRYDWDNTRYWVPTLVGGMGASAILAVVPTAVMSADHVFPHNGAALAFGIITMVLGIIAFFSCFGGIIAKAD